MLRDSPQYIVASPIRRTFARWMRAGAPKISTRLSQSLFYLCSRRRAAIDGSETSERPSRGLGVGAPGPRRTDGGFDEEDEEDSTPDDAGAAA